MARNLRLLLAVALAARVTLADVDHRGAACKECHKLCPISCFVGTCGLNTAYSVRKFGATNKCYSCDPAVSVGVSRDGDYMRCEASESGVSESGKSPFSAQNGMTQGPQGPAIPGNAGLAALKASQQAQIAVQAATKASIYADKAAKAATAKYREITGTGGKGNQVFSDEQAAENHQTATQIRAEESLRVAEAAHVAWKAAMAKYNIELAKLRKQQLITDHAEKTLEGAEAASEKARGEYAKMQAEAQHAMEQAMLNGGSAASKITSQAAAEELAGAAMAAHRRLVIAAKEAKDASEKIAIASSMAPCVGVFMQVSRVRGAPPVIGCTSIAEKEAQDNKIADARILRLTPPQLPAFAPPAASQPAVVPGFEEMEEEPAVPTEGQLEIPSLEQQMTSQLAEKLASNPAAVQDASLFAVPSVPFNADQHPVDGMEQPASFDLATISALQTSGGRGNLRQGKMQP